MSLSPWQLPQRDRAELLDLHAANLGEVRRSLADIARINTYLGGAKPVCDSVWRFVDEAGLTSATVLDIGTGNADIPRRLMRQAKWRRFDLNVVALDINARHLEIARETLVDETCIHPIQADAFALPFPDQSVDVVISTLFLHHFRAPQIEQLLREFTRVSRVGWSMHDTSRARLPLLFFRLVRPIFARSYLTRHDAEVSIHRAYTPGEMTRIVAPLANVCVESQFPYRLSVEWKRDL